MTKARKTKTRKAKPKTRQPKKQAAKKQAKPPKSKNLSQLRGFARLAVTDPARLQAISRKAGKKAQRLFGHKVRWSAAKARKLASSGGKAAQKKYRKSGHPWAAGSPLRPGTKPVRVRRRARTLPTGIPLLPKPGPEPEPEPDDQMIAPTTPLPEAPHVAEGFEGFDSETDAGV